MSTLDAQDISITPVLQVVVCWLIDTPGFEYGRSHEPPLLLELELEELLEELELLLEDELLELDELELLLDEFEPSSIVPADAVNVTASSAAPSSRLSILKVCAPAARLLNVARVNDPQPLVAELFCVFQEPESSL